MLQSPMYTFNDHLSSVKAIAFNPHQMHSLATGGGITDRCVKFWNLSSGTLCHSFKTDSQVILQLQNSYSGNITLLILPKQVLTDT